MILKSKSKLNLFNIFFFVLIVLHLINQKVMLRNVIQILNFFSVEVIKITGDINSAEIHVDLGYFALNELSFKRRKCLKFY